MTVPEAELVNKRWTKTVIRLREAQDRLIHTADPEVQQLINTLIKMHESSDQTEGHIIRRICENEATRNAESCHTVKPPLPQTAAARALTHLALSGYIKIAMGQLEDSALVLDRLKSERRERKRLS